MVADVVLGFTTSIQTSGRQIPKFRKEFRKFVGPVNVPARSGQV